MKFFYWVSEEVCPYHNLALERYLMEIIPEDSVFLYLWQNDDTIVVGRNQDIYRECKVEEFIKDGGKLARRYSGGGAVYHDIGNLNYSIVCSSVNEEKNKYHLILRNALSMLGIKAEYNYRNDLTINGKKISGNAVYKLGELVCQHGTVLINTDIERMSFYLTPNISKLSRNHVQSVDSRVGNISDIDSNIEIKDIKEALIKTVHAKPLEIMLNCQRINELTALQKNEEWIFGGKK